MLNNEQKQELVAAYRGAKDKQKQIRILSECYLIAENYVRRILDEAGVLVPEDAERKKPGRPKGSPGRKPGPKPAAAKKDEKPETPQPPEPDPNPVPAPQPEPKEQKAEEKTTGQRVPLGEAVRKTQDAPAESFGETAALKRSEFDAMLEEALALTRKEKEEAQARRRPAAGWTVPEIKAEAFDVIIRMLRGNADEDGVIAARPVTNAVIGLGMLIEALEEAER